MPGKTRVLICDDSAAMRRILTSVLSAEGDIEVVYRAQHGQDALDNLSQAKPDVVVLDVLMPVMNGIETVRAIRRRDADLPILMFSAVTAAGARATLEAMSAGASDFAEKPTSVGHLDRAVQIVKEDLVVKIKELARRKRRSLPKATNVASKTIETNGQTLSVESPASFNTQVEMVVVGVSTGGPKVLEAMLSRLDIKCPVLIVQHMPPIFTAQLADRLNSVSRMKVREGIDGAAIGPGQVWIAPGDYHMEVTRDHATTRLKLHQQPRENSVRPAADPLFRSVAQCYGDAVLALVLTGMGKDGLNGCRQIKERGGHVIVQDKSTSAVWGMPGQVAEAGLADCIVPVDKLANEVNRLTYRTTPKPISAR